MTECERLISEGLFDKSFFKEEVRNDFFVDTTRKKVWAIEIDLLLQLDRVCRKYGFQYYLMFGSLLGAVRHHGFIPWDDDLDVCMPRKDYEELLKVAPSEFKDPYFFQIPETDKGFFYTFAKIRNSNTTAFLELFQYQRFNMGLMIDVMPMDVCDLDDVEEHYYTIQKLTRENTTYMRMTHPHLSAADRERVKNYRGGVPLDRYHEIQNIAKVHEAEGGRLNKRITAVNTIYHYSKMILDASDLSQTISCPFEGFEFPIPVGFDNILKTIYGNYMAFPPVQERGNWHSDYIIDPDHSYRKYYHD